MTAMAQTQEAFGTGEAHIVRHTTHGKSCILANTAKYSLLQTRVVMSLPWSIEHLEGRGTGVKVCLRILVIDLPVSAVWHIRGTIFSAHKLESIRRVYAHCDNASQTSLASLLTAHGNCCRRHARTTRTGARASRSARCYMVSRQQ
jgi:hypothetical protein